MWMTLGISFYLLDWMQGTAAYISVMCFTSILTHAAMLSPCFQTRFIRKCLTNPMEMAHTELCSQKRLTNTKKRAIIQAH